MASGASIVDFFFFFLCAATLKELSGYFSGLCAMALLFHTNATSSVCIKIISCSYCSIWKASAVKGKHVLKLTHIWG